LDTSRDRLTQLIENLNPPQWTFRPDTESWSIAEITTHLVQVENGRLQAIEKALSESAATDDVLQKVEGKESRILKRVMDRSTKVKSPVALVRIFEDPATALRDFQTARKRSIALHDQPLLKSRVLSHFVLGDMTCYQWLMFLAAHTHRHCSQVEEVIEHPAFPPPTISLTVL
jgi:uncharacterized damage-inducible protein DinB